MIRSFTDAAGNFWEVWEAHPSLRERRALRDRRAGARGAPDRRTNVVQGFSPGWLVFRSEMGRRRLREIPPDWGTTDVEGLRWLLTRATRPSGALKWNE